jgi:diacylglycerol kinase (ATP)
MRAAGMEFDVEFTRKAGDAERLAAQATHDVVVAAGGDGTVHEVVNGLMPEGSRAALSVIPLGSGDDFAKLLSRDRQTFDLGRITAEGRTRYFANGMDIGFGAHGAANVARVPRFLTGFGAYLGALLLTMVRYPRLDLRLTVDGGEPQRVRTAMTALMNGTTFGGSFRVTPGAAPDDGWLDMLIVDAIGRPEILLLVQKILRGTHVGDPRVRLVKVRRVTIECAQPLLVEADGEIVFRDLRRLEVEILPAALRVQAGNEVMMPHH